MTIQPALNHADKTPRIPIIELFGPTVQGEGLMTGTVSHFLRTGGCGLRCSWCDSMYAVEPAQVKTNRKMMTTAEILHFIEGMPFAPYITFTGGDPCLQKHLGDLIPGLNMRNMMVAVETQGQQFPDWLKEADVVTFSPKGPSSGNVVDPAPLITWLTEMRGIFRGRICIKVVVFITGKEYDFNDVAGDLREEESPGSGPGGIPEYEWYKTDLEYAMYLYRLIPPELYDAFYFTAGTPPFDPHEDPTVRTLRVLHSERLLADHLMTIARQQATPSYAPEQTLGPIPISFNQKVHMGAQNHVLLWPTEESGV